MKKIIPLFLVVLMMVPMAAIGASEHDFTRPITIKWHTHEYHLT